MIKYEIKFGFFSFKIGLKCKLNSWWYSWRCNSWSKNNYRFVKSVIDLLSSERKQQWMEKRITISEKTIVIWLYSLKKCVLNVWRFGRMLRPSRVLEIDIFGHCVQGWKSIELIFYKKKLVSIDFNALFHSYWKVMFNLNGQTFFIFDL